LRPGKKDGNWELAGIDNCQWKRLMAWCNQTYVYLRELNGHMQSIKGRTGNIYEVTPWVQTGPARWQRPEYYPICMERALYTVRGLHDRGKYTKWACLWEVPRHIKKKLLLQNLLFFNLTVNHFCLAANRRPSLVLDKLIVVCFLGLFLFALNDKSIVTVSWSHNFAHAAIMVQKQYL
jgi:hypothetical protein